MTDLRSYAGQFLDYLVSRDTRASVDEAVGLADEGISVAQVLTEVVAPAMEEVGERWQRDELNVADEHAATAIADTVVSILTTAGADDSAIPPVVVVACAEGEWHTLPPRLLAGALQADGYDVTFLGPSMPPTHLARFLDRSRPDLLGISCSTPLTFEGVLSCVRVGHEAGIPVLVGGRGLGVDDRRARVLGADLWAPSASAVPALLQDPLPEHMNEPSADFGAATELARERDGMVAAAMDELSRRLPAMAHFDDFQRARTSEDLAYIIRFATAAVLTRDRRVFDDFLVWLDALLLARGVPAGTTAVSLDAIRSAAGPPALVELLDGVRTTRPTGDPSRR